MGLWVCGFVGVFCQDVVQCVISIGDCNATQYTLDCINRKTWFVERVLKTWFVERVLKTHFVLFIQIVRSLSAGAD
jgi:hypothetical protein